MLPIVPLTPSSSLLTFTRRLTLESRQMGIHVCGDQRCGSMICSVEAIGGMRTTGEGYQKAGILGACSVGTSPLCRTRREFDDGVDWIGHAVVPTREPPAANAP